MNMFTFCHRERLRLYWSLYTKYMFYCVWIYSPSVTEKDLLCIGRWIKKYISYYVWMCSLSLREKDLLCIGGYIQNIHFFMCINVFTFCRREGLNLYWRLYSNNTFLTNIGEFICPLCGFIFNPTGCPTNPPHWYSSWGAGLVANTPFMRLVVLGYMVPVAEKNSEQTHEPANEENKSFSINKTLYVKNSTYLYLPVQEKKYFGEHKRVCRLHQIYTFHNCMNVFTFCHWEGLTMYWSLYTKNTLLIVYKYIRLLSQRKTYSVLEFIYKQYIYYCVGMCSPCHIEGLILYWSLNTNNTFRFWSLYTVYTYLKTWKERNSFSRCDVTISKANVTICPTSTAIRPNTSTHQYTVFKLVLHKNFIVSILIVIYDIFQNTSA